MQSLLPVSSFLRLIILTAILCIVSYSHASDYFVESAGNKCGDNILCDVAPTGNNSFLISAPSKILNIKNDVEGSSSLDHPDGKIKLNGNHLKAASISGGSSSAFVITD